MSGHESLFSDRTWEALLRRTYWREGDLGQRLKAVEKAAKQRAAGKRYTDDPQLDREVAKLARRIRKDEA